MKTFVRALTIGGLFAIAAPALAADGTISGTITHAADNTPIVTIYVSAVNTTTGVSASIGATDADGDYTLTVAPGTWDVTPYTWALTETGVTFIKQTLTVTVGDGQAVVGKNFSMTRRAKFSGHVYGSDGTTPVANASMYITSAAGSANGYTYATTASTGFYTGTPTPTDATQTVSGTFTFSVSATGYFSKTFTDVALGASETTTTYDMTLTSASTVTGTVTDANGAAIPSATVSITRSTGVAYSAQTNGVGVYTVSIFDSFNTSAVGDFNISVSKTGYVTKTSALSITADASSFTGQNYTLATAGSIAGTVKDSAGVAVSGATVSANDGFGNTFSTTTAADGTYTVNNLPASSHYFLTVTKTYYVGQKLYGITVTAGTATSGKNVTVPTAKSFTGTVKGSGNAPIEGAIVYLYKRNKTRSEISDFSYTTKSDGTFSFLNVSPGKYRMKIVKTGYVNFVKENLNVASSLANQTYTLTLGAVFFGRVTSGSAVVASADVAVYALKNGKEVSYAATTTDENGYYRVGGLKKGDYRIKVTSTDYVMKMVNVPVNAGQQKTVNIAVKAAGSVSGFITDSVTGLPVSVFVKVVGKPVSTSSDANGYFVLDGIAPGKRQIKVVSQYYGIPGAKTVTVTTGVTTKNVTFSLTPK